MTPSKIRKWRERQGLSAPAYVHGAVYMIGLGLMAVTPLYFDNWAIRLGSAILGAMTVAGGEAWFWRKRGRP